MVFFGGHASRRANVRVGGDDRFERILPRGQICGADSTKRTASTDDVLEHRVPRFEVDGTRCIADVDDKVPRAGNGHDGSGIPGKCYCRIQGGFHAIGRFDATAALPGTCEGDDF